MKKIAVIIMGFIGNVYGAQFPAYPTVSSLGTNDLIIISHWDGTQWDTTRTIKSTNLIGQILSLSGGGGGDTIWTNDNGTISATSAVIDESNAISYSLFSTNYLTGTDGDEKTLFRLINGTNDGLSNRVFRVNSRGGLATGSSVAEAEYGDEAIGAIEISRSVESGDDPLSEIYMESILNSSYDSYGTVALRTYADGRTELSLDGTPEIAPRTLAQITSGGDVSGGLTITLKQVSDGGINYVVLDPLASDGFNPFLFKSSLAHTFGDLLRLDNNTTEVFNVAAVSGWTGAGTLFFADDGKFKQSLWSDVGGTITGNSAVANGGVTFSLNSSNTLTSGNLLEVKNNGTLKDSFAFNGTITPANITASRALMSDSASGITNSVVTSTELGYVSGVTSSIQTQISTKAPATSGSALLKGNGLGGFSSAIASTDYIAATTGSEIQKASSGGLVAAVSGIDYPPIASPTFTGILTVPTASIATAKIGTLTLTNGTLFNLITDAWTNAGTVYYTLRTITTNTASAANSKLFSFELSDGTIIASGDKSGAVRLKGPVGVVSGIGSSTSGQLTILDPLNDSGPDGSSCFIFGRNGQNLKLGTANTSRWEVSSTNGMLYPTTDNFAAIGSSEKRMSNVVSMGFASFANAAAVTIAATGWTNTFLRNANVFIDGVGVTYVLYTSAGTAVYTNAATITYTGAIPLQPGGAVVVTAGTGVSGRAVPW